MHTHSSQIGLREQPTLLSHLTASYDTSPSGRQVLGQPLPVMRLLPPGRATHRDNRKRVENGVAREVVGLDLADVDRPAYDEVT